MTVTKAKIKAVADLRDAAERVAQGRMRLEGPRLAEEGIRRGRAIEAFVSEDARERPTIEAAAAARGVPCFVVAPHELDRMVEVRTPAGALVVAHRNAPMPLESILAAHASIVYLEGVQDPGNVGAIARSAAALGVTALILGPGTADPTAPKTLRASAGALIDVPYARDVDVEDVVRAAPRSGHALLVAAVREGMDPRRFAAPPRRILIVSHEGSGTRVRRDAAGVVLLTVPLAAGAESLNVAAAAAILLDRLRGS